MTRKRQPQTQPDGGHAQPVDPGALPPEALAAAKPLPQALPPAAQKLQEIEDEMQDLAGRVENLEGQVVARPPQPPAQAQAQTAGTNEPEAGPTRLQDVLPDIKDLSNKVGGLEHLAEIVDALKETKR